MNTCGAVMHTAWSASTSWTDAPGMARASFSRRLAGTPLWCEKLV